MKYHGKFESPRKSRRMTKAAVLALALALVLLVSVGGTLAYLFTSTDPVQNVFAPAEMNIKVMEDEFQNQVSETKSKVYVQNKSKASVYIRVALVPTWEDSEGNAVAVAASLADLEINGVAGDQFKNANGWVKHTDGYFYYTSAVAAGDKTNNLIDTAVVTTSSNHYMDLQILAQAIQAEGVDAYGKRPVELAWGVTVDANGNISK